jgi:hypothetical protein
MPGQAESTTPAPFGLYSYLLLGAAPVEPTRRARYVETMRAYLEMLPSVQGLERSGVSRASLNVTYVPVEDARVAAAADANDPQAPELMVRHYDYARARAMLAKVPGGPHVDGPYLLSYREPLGRVQRLASGYGWVDMSGVPAARAPRWVRVFVRETAQQDYTQALTPVRTWTAILDELERAGEGAPSVLKALVFWLPAK